MMLGNKTEDFFNLIFYLRYYVSSDILHRVLTKYLGYDVLYCININDIDDNVCLF